MNAEASVSKELKCPICQSHKTRRLRELRESNIDYRPTLTSCGSCGAEFLLPAPNENQLNQIYRDYFGKRDSGLKDAKISFFAALVENLGIDLSGKKILEIGGGEGYFARALIAKYPDLKLSVVEPNISKEAFADLLTVNLVSMSLENYLEESHEKFDFIFLFDVIEHLVNPGSALSKIKFLLSAEGRLIATFPDVSSSSRALLGSLWPQYKLEHVFYFTRLAIDRLGLDSGLTTLDYRPLKKTLPVGYLLKVGSEFGPATTRRLVRIARRFVPNSIGNKQLKFNFGEALWIAGSKGLE